jgi:molybdopterin synthase sulfur carrier subunit
LYPSRSCCHERQILYFAGLKEKLGLPGESIDLPDGVAPSAACVTGWSPRAATSWPPKNLRCAVNQDMAKLDAQ